MISYDILQLDFNNKSITFAFDNDQNKSIKINIKDGFENYVEATKLDYYIDTSNNELVRVPGASQYMTFKKLQRVCFYKMELFIDLLFNLKLSMKIKI